ncbi:MAG: hypothetical protein J7513_18310, partial [Solirubrobacteraceae bacterium]|nr:hypothetical protein [Solirubrobacteraceae bacterium]
MSAPRTWLLGLAAVASLGLGAAPAGAEEILQLDLANPANGTPGGVAAQSQPLTSGAAYVVTIEGTGSLWSTPSDPWTSYCGEPEAAPITQPSAGMPDTPPTADAAVIFAAPTGSGFMGGQACSGANPTSPPAPGRLLMGSVASGMTPAIPMGGQPTHADPAHRYAYAVTGDGTALQLQYDDSVVFDNSGIFTVTVWTDLECTLADCLGTGVVPTPTPTPVAPTPTPV